MPVQLIEKNWMSGCIIEGVEWCTNGHWMMQSEFVKVPEAGLRAWHSGEPWSAGPGRRSPVNPETLKSILDQGLEGDPGEFTELFWGNDNGWRARLVLSKEGGRYACNESVPERGIFFYTHWEGTELPETLKAALERGRDRWRDNSYLSRIIFSEMIKANVLEDTGYGISVDPGDGRDRVIPVDLDAQTVRFGSCDRVGNEIKFTYSGEPVSFEDFVEADEIVWPD